MFLPRVKKSFCMVLLFVFLFAHLFKILLHIVLGKTVAIVCDGMNKEEIGNET